MKKLSVCVIFDGTQDAPEAEARSAAYILRCLDREKYNLFPVGITEDGDWVLYGGDDPAQVEDGSWRSHPNNRRAAISPVRDQGLLSFERDCVVREWIDVAIPVPGVSNDHAGALQGLLELAGIPCVGASVSSAVTADRSLTRLVGHHLGWRQTKWATVHIRELDNAPEAVLDDLSRKLAYPMLVRSMERNAAEMGWKADDRTGLKDRLVKAAANTQRILVEACLNGCPLRVAVMGNGNPMASECGVVGDDPVSEEIREQAREMAVRIYSAMNCRGMVCVSFVVEQTTGELFFSDLDPFPEFSEGSFCIQLFDASGFSGPELLEELLKRAMEERR